MKTSRGLILSLLLVAALGGAYWQFQDKLVSLSSGTAAPQHPTPGAAPNSFTEERWTVMEVCDQIVHLLLPQSPEAAKTNRITAQRNQSRPVSYAVEGRLAKGTVTLNMPVWDPATYQAWCQAVTQTTPTPGLTIRQNILVELLNPGTDTYLAIDARLSEELARQSADPGLCTDAALLLGTMAWLDGAGHFQDVRPLLNRMTAFLAVADLLGASGPKREAAEMLRLVLIHDQTAALEKITAARQTAKDIPVAWLDALEVTATGDWRKTQPHAASAPALLQLAHYRVLTRNMSANQAENFMKSLKGTAGAEWVRFIAQADLGIRQGHAFCRTLPGIEAEDANKVAKALGEQSILKPGESLVSFVQGFDGTASYERAPETRVVGKQLWAGRAQRHLMQSMLVLHHFVQKRWGVPDQAAAFVAEMRQQFSKAYYWPFVELELEKAGSPHHQDALLAGDKLARERPATIAPKLWAALKPETADAVRRGSPDFHHFFNPELPRHTSFEAGKRIYEIGVGDENSLNVLDEILARCPYDFEMAFQTALVEGRPSNVEDKRLECCERFADTWQKALQWVVSASAGNPQKYERLRAREAENEPDAYVQLASYFKNRGDIERAEKYLLLARGKVDAVYFANSCRFLVQHYAHTGRMKEAEAIAREAGDTHSAIGLATHAWLKEHQQQWEEAAKLYRAIDERYGHREALELTAYALRRKAAGRGWDAKYQPLVDSIFPRGIEKISLANLGSAAPATGACFTELSAQVRSTGIGLKDVIVGLDGVRVETREQYFAARNLSDSPDMVFLIWDGHGYSETKVRQPDRRFNTDLRTYRR